MHRQQKGAMPEKGAKKKILPSNNYASIVPNFNQIPPWYNFLQKFLQLKQVTMSGTLPPRGS